MLYNPNDQNIGVPLESGDRITIFSDIDRDEGGFMGDVSFEGTVEKYVPKLGLLTFEEEGEMEMEELVRLIKEGEGIQII